MELHLFVAVEMCGSQERLLSIWTPSIFTDGDGLSGYPETTNEKDAALFRFGVVPTRRSAVLDGSFSGSWL